MIFLFGIHAGFHYLSLMTPCNLLFFLKILSNVFVRFDVRATQSVIFRKFLYPPLNCGAIIAYLRVAGITPVSRDFLSIERHAMPVLYYFHQHLYMVYFSMLSSFHIL